MHNPVNPYKFGDWGHIKLCGITAIYFFVTLCYRDDVTVFTPRMIPYYFAKFLQNII